MELSAAQQKVLLDLARATIVSRLKRQPAVDVDVSAEVFAQTAGSFVTLHTIAGHHLRGCIGTLNAIDPLRQSVTEMAQAVLDDPRFRSNPVTLAELPLLDLEISIISPLLPANDVLDFDPLQHGIYLLCDGEAGCFLPQVAKETGWSKPQLLEHLCIGKMGLPGNAWKNPSARLFRFTATVIGPEPFSTKYT